MEQQCAPSAGTTAPQPIRDCLADHHVVSLAVVDSDGVWAASCFYAFDASAMDLIILSSLSTRHGQAMRAAPVIAGTVAGQPERILDIRGVQFLATAEQVQGADRRGALRHYQRRHPLARLSRSEVWRLHLDHVKLTENRLAFAHKTHWSRRSDLQDSNGAEAPSDKE